MYVTYGRTQHHAMVTNLMTVLSLEEDVPCAVAAPSKGCFITMLGQQLLDGAICVRNHTFHVHFLCYKAVPLVECHMGS